MPDDILKKIGRFVKEGTMERGAPDNIHTRPETGCKMDEDAIEKIKKGEPVGVTCSKRFINPENDQDIVETAHWEAIVNPLTGKDIEVLDQRARSAEELEEIQRIGRSAVRVKSKQTTGI